MWWDSFGDRRTVPHVISLSGAPGISHTNAHVQLMWGDVRRRRAAVCTSYAMPPARIGLSASGTTTELRTSVHFDAVQAGRHDCGTHDRVVSECVVDTSTSDASSAAV